MTDSNQPPVGAMVTDADGREWVMRDYCAGPTWTFIADQYPSPRTTSALTALWRMQQERDHQANRAEEAEAAWTEEKQDNIRLKARVADLEGTLVGIRDANWRAWGGSTADDFVEWAKSRARHVLGEVTP